MKAANISGGKENKLKFCFSDNSSYLTEISTGFVLGRGTRFAFGAWKQLIWSLPMSADALHLQITHRPCSWICFNLFSLQPTSTSAPPSCVVSDLIKVVPAVISSPPHPTPPPCSCALPLIRKEPRTTKHDWIQTRVSLTTVVLTEPIFYILVAHTVQFAWICDGVSVMWLSNMLSLIIAVLSSINFLMLDGRTSATWWHDDTKQQIPPWDLWLISLWSLTSYLLLSHPSFFI